jgi:hypothetical protein
MLVEFWPLGIRELGDEPEDVLRSYRRLGYGLDIVGRPLGSGADDRTIVDAAESVDGGFVTLELAPHEGG